MKHVFKNFYYLRKLFLNFLELFNVKNDYNQNFKCLIIFEIIFNLH